MSVNGCFALLYHVWPPGTTNTIHTTKSLKLALWPTKMHNGKWVVFKNYWILTQIQCCSFGGFIWIQNTLTTDD